MSDRPPFDPSRIRPSPEDGPDWPIPATLSVRQVNELVRGAINKHLPATLHILGEIGDLSRPGSGHLYFTLKDSFSELRCVMWRSSFAKLKFNPAYGMEIVATGNIEVYPPRGTYQLIVTKLEPRGMGALELAFRQMKEKLEREGLFDPARKKPLPRVPRRAAIVTSLSGAAIRDMLRTLERRFPALEILLFPVRVQGEGAAAEIAGAVGWLNEISEKHWPIDVAIVGRGGGSLEDLWAFNEEVVVRAIFASRVPIVSAVGHETDTTLSDLVADLRAATPTAAAELIAPQLADLLETIDRALLRVRRAAGHGLDLMRAHLRTLLQTGGLARPLVRLRERGQLIDELQQRLRLATVERFRRLRDRLNRGEMAALRFGTGAQFARVQQRLTRQTYRLQRALGQIAVVGEKRLNARLTRLEHIAPSHRLGRLEERLQQAARHLASALRHAVAQKKRLLETRVVAAEARDPRRILRRGYSITYDAKTRRVIRSVKEIQAGQRIITQVSDGEFRGTADDPKQPGLFE